MNDVIITPKPHRKTSSPQRADRSDDSRLLWQTFSGRVVRIDGVKGGPGKSLTAKIVFHECRKLGIDLEVIDCDANNADVYRAVKSLDGVAARYLPLTGEDKWLPLLDYLTSRPRDNRTTTIINMPAAGLEVSQTQWPVFEATLDEHNIPHTAVWVASPAYESIELYAQYLNARPARSKGALLVVCNTFFGSRDKYELLLHSKTMARAVALGARWGFMPVITPRIATALNQQKLALETALRELPTQDRIELERNLRNMEQMFRDLAGGNIKATAAQGLAPFTLSEKDL